jgi:hypothetical protein
MPFVDLMGEWYFDENMIAQFSKMQTGEAEERKEGHKLSAQIMRPALFARSL